MFSSHILSRLLRFWLLAFFIVGLFVSVGELSVNRGEEISLSQGGIYTVVAAENEAVTPGANDTKTTEPESKTLEAFIDIANLFIGVLTFLITPLIMLAGWLLSPDWTFGEIFWLRPILHQIWIFISNIVYVIFGFFLVFIAFANIFGWENAKAYEMKTMLPKLVIGILIVPFTWFIVSAVLSISNILTASVIQLPIDTIQKAGSAGTFLDDKIIPKTIVYNKDHDYDKDKDAGGNIDSTYDKKSGWWVAVKDEYKANGNFYATDCEKAPDGCLSIQEFLSNGKGGAYNLLSVYAYGIFKIQDYKMITTKEKLKTLGGIASKLSFGFLFFVVFSILIIAIVYALFSRALILWLYAMFSPIFALNYVMEFKNESVKGSVGRMSIEKFLSLALVPVYVSAALAFGLMFLGLVMNAKWATPTGAGWENGKITWDIVQWETKDWISTFTFWDVTLTTKWVLTKDQKSGLNGALDLGKGVIGTIIMNVLALVILWMAVMAALNADEVTKSAVAPIKSFGDKVGELALKSPQYIPIPLPGGSKVSMAGLQSIPSTIDSTMSQKASKEGWEIWQAFAKGLGFEVSELTTALQQATNKLKWIPWDIKGQKEVWKDIYGKIWDEKNLNTNKAELIPKFKEMLAVTAVDPAVKKTLEESLEKNDIKWFIKWFEEYLDKNNIWWFSSKNPLNTNEYLQSIKDNTTPQVTISSITIDPADKSKGTIDVTRWTVSIPKVEVKDWKLADEWKLKNTLKAKGIEQGQIDGIVQDIESQIIAANSKNW